MARFRLGINYWPARTAMGWWSDFDRGEAAADFSRIHSAGFDSVRIFLTWERFQPRPDRVDRESVERLVATLDAAAEAGLVVMPTLFTGHMSGVNFVPPWALGGDGGDARFRVVSSGRVVNTGLESWYTNPEIPRAQAFLARELGAAICAHPALWAWDLGNENSNCVIPPTRAAGREWLARITDALRHSDAKTPLTIGLHMEDLEQDRKIGPAEAAEVCDFLTMHGYPGYASWARGPTDEALLPFLASVTRWLGGGAEVSFSELGVPSYRAGEPRSASSAALIEETEAASYIERALAALLACGCSGAAVWCHADYVPSLWQTPPFDLAVHERSFGLWRADGSAKPALAAVKRFDSARAIGQWRDDSFIDVARDEFYLDPGGNLARLYRRYCDRS